MRLTWNEWKEEKALLNEFAEHNNADGEKAVEIAEKIKAGAVIEIPDNVYAEMKKFTDGIRFIRRSFESFWKDVNESKGFHAEMAHKETELTQYKVSYIDGHDLKYKTFITCAESPEDAVTKMRESYESDFDHQIIDVREEKVIGV